MKALFWAILAGYCVSAAAENDLPSAAGLEYKGIRFGSTQAELLTAHPEFRCTQDRDQSEDSTCLITPRCHFSSRSSQTECEREYSERFTYAGEPALVTMAIFHKNQLVSASAKFRPPSYERIRNALSAKYGAANETAEPVTTNSGVTYENRLARWELPDGVIRVRRLSGRIDEGMVSLMSTDYLNLVQTRKKAKASTAPGDL